MKINTIKTLLLSLAMSISITGLAMADTTTETISDTSTDTTAESTEATAPVIDVKATINSCVIASDKTTVTFTWSSSGSTDNTDGIIYILQMKPYQAIEDIVTRTDYLAMAPIGQDGSYTLNLNDGTKDDILYDSFLPTVWDGTKYIAVGSDYAITNPELVTKNDTPYKKPSTKKGLAMEYKTIADAVQLGAKHASVNIAFHQIAGNGIDYVYDGETYHFSSDFMATLDKNINGLSSRSITVTAIILNGWNPDQPNLFVPGTTPTSKAEYYLFNVFSEEGFKQTRATIAFLGERYDGNHGHGKVSNWIIGNEINSQQWNYVGDVSLDTYMHMYEKVFRVFYTALKKACSGNRVFFSLDYNWNNAAENRTNYKYGGKETVDAFNSIATGRGKMDWGLAYHSYSCPMTEPEFWDDDQTGLFTEDYNSPVINFKNLHLLTDYFRQSQLLNGAGEVRPIILTEQGFTATSPTRGDVSTIQAAAFAYSYYIVDSNPYIDLYILGRQVDAPPEVRLGLSFGLWACDMNQPNDAVVPTARRKILGVFNNIDDPRYTLEVSEFAKPIIGISKWSDVIPDFKWSSQEK